jgi:hypothetical protein
MPDTGRAPKSVILLVAANGKPIRATGSHVTIFGEGLYYLAYCEVRHADALFEATAALRMSGLPMNEKTPTKKHQIRSIFEHCRRWGSSAANAAVLDLLVVVEAAEEFRVAR